MTDGPTYESLQEEVETVIDRHRELFASTPGYAVAMIIHAVEAERARRGVDLDVVEAGPEGVWYLDFGDGTGALLGAVDRPEVLPDLDIDLAVADFGQGRAMGR